MGKKCFLQCHGMAHKHQHQTGTTARVTHEMLDTLHGNKAVSWLCVGVNGINRFTVTWDLGYHPSSGWLTTAQNTNSFKSSRTDGQIPLNDPEIYGVSTAHWLGNKSSDSSYRFWKKEDLCEVCSTQSHRQAEGPQNHNMWMNYPDLRDRPTFSK